MASDREAQDYARDCVRLAELTTDPQIGERPFPDGTRVDGSRHA
jgi:hypothetical protein